MSRPLVLLAAALLAALLLAGQASAQAPEPQASLPDLEDEVMCTVCGTTLQLSTSPQAERQRAFINGLIAAGRDKEEIKDALVAEYGSEVLAVPSTSGFDLTAWVIPIAGMLAALVAIALAARRWRAQQRATVVADGTPVAGIDPGDEERLAADLRRYEP